MTILYLIKVGIDLNPFLITLTNINNLIDFSKLDIPNEYSHLPFQLEVILFDEKGDGIQYIKEDSYSFRLVKDLKEITKQLVNYAEIA